MRDDSDVYCKPIDASTVAALMPKITPQLEPVGECGSQRFLDEMSARALQAQQETSEDE